MAWHGMAWFKWRGIGWHGVAWQVASVAAVGDGGGWRWQYMYYHRQSPYDEATTGQHDARERGRE
jgi:hypothetical protein